MNPTELHAPVPHFRYPRSKLPAVPASRHDVRTSDSPGVQMLSNVSASTGPDVPVTGKPRSATTEPVARLYACLMTAPVDGTACSDRPERSNLLS
jgi:hypothetical protein